MLKSSTNPFAFSIRDADFAAPQPGDAETLPRFVMDEKGEVLYATPAMLELFGAAETSDIAAALKLESAPRKKLHNLPDGLYTLTSKGGLHSAPFRFDWMSRESGQKVLIASHAAEDTPPPEPDSGEMEGFVHTLERRLLQRTSHPAALWSRDDMSHFIGISSDMMLTMDTGGTILKANPVFYELTGANSSQSDLPSLPLLFCDADRPLVRRTLQSLSLQGRDEALVDTIDFEARMTPQQGGLLWSEWKLRREDGKIFAIGRDISAIKAHEQDLVKRQLQLVEAENIGRMGHWRWVVGEESMEWSDQIYRMFGRKRDEFIPTIDSLNMTVHRRDVGRVIQAFQRAMIEQNTYDMDFRITRPGGDTRYIQCEGRCELDAQGEVVALFGIMQDMTERMVYERNLREAKESAERAYAAKSQFLANMSHELRTPLNAIIGFSEMMERQLLGPIGTEKYLDYIAGIRESGEHLLDLISDILDMSKIEAGKYELSPEDINVAKTLKLAVHMMQGRAHESGVRLITDQLSDEGPSLQADRRAFMQVILNLLSNAVKFTNSGGSVWLELEERADAVHIKVSDTGIGIPANKLNTITRPFEQASNSYARSHEGSGLGLAITKELVELHGGSLSIESTVGVGTSVTVKFPLKVARAA
jgi:two-component system cell cycle sensor histidine kinase PleC